MGLPANANIIVVHGYWLDELTGVGVKQTSGLPATILFEPVPLLGANVAKTPNLRDIASNAYLKTRTRVATVDPDTGYFAAQLVASNDPDLEAYAGRRVTLLGEDPFVIEVPCSALSTTVDATMAAKTGLAQGSSVRAIWLTEAAIVGSPAPQPTNSYLTSSQTLATIASGIETALAGVPEIARDAVGAALVAGSGITVTVNDNADTITIAATGGGGSYSDEQAQDAFAALLAAGTHSGISFTYNDAGNAISATVTGGGGSVSDATTGAKGVVQLAGDLAGTAAAPTVPGLAAKAPLNLPVRSVSANTTAVAGEFLKVDAAGGTRTISPPASPATGTQVVLAKVDSTSNAVIWSATVDGDSQGAQLTGQWTVVTFVYDGSQWLLRSTNLSSASSGSGGASDATTSSKGIVQLAGDLAGTAASPTVPGLAARQQFLTPTATKTSAYTAAGNDYVLADVTSAWTLTLPTAPPDKTRIGAKVVVQPGTSALTIAVGGSDRFNTTAGPTTGAISLLNQAVIWQYNAATAVWIAQSSDLPLSQLDTRYDAAGAAAAKTPTSRQVTAGTGLSGGGDLTADRTLSVTYGTTAGTAAQGNDSRLSDATTSSKGIVQLAGDLGGTAASPTVPGLTSKAATSYVDALNNVLPAGHGYITWSMDPGMATSNSAPTTGIVTLIRVRVGAATSVSNTVMWQAVAGASVTNAYFGLYDSSGTQLGVSTDQSSNLVGTGARTVALSGAPLSLAAGYYYVAVLIGAATTVPQFSRSASSAIVNVGLAAPSLRFAASGTGLTALPSTITMSSTTGVSIGYWAALS